MPARRRGLLGNTFLSETKFVPELDAGVGSDEDLAKNSVAVSSALFLLAIVGVGDAARGVVTRLTASIPVPIGFEGLDHSRNEDLSFRSTLEKGNVSVSRSNSAI